MKQGKRTHTRERGIPAELREYLGTQLDSFGDPGLSGEGRGRFCYVTYEGKPLCRLGYRGEREVWDFAIYKYSSERYSTSEPLFPLRGTIVECVTIAMNAYNLR